jgi:hypothetical protein
LEKSPRENEDEGLLPQKKMQPNFALLSPMGQCEHLPQPEPTSSPGQEIIQEKHHGVTTDIILFCWFRSSACMTNVIATKYQRKAK